MSNSIGGHGGARTPSMAAVMPTVPSACAWAVLVLLSAVAAWGQEVARVPGETWRPSLAQAAPYPHDVVTLLTHSSPGSGSDLFLRELARHLGPQMGVDFVVEHVPGGGGARAMSRLANARPDGSVFYAATPSFIFTSLLSRPANTFRDLEPLLNVFLDQEVVYTRSEGPFETFAQVIDSARSGRGRWGAASPGSLERQALERLRVAADVQAAIVTHDGGGDLILNVLNGTLDIGVGEAQEIRSQLVSGNLRLLAVFSDARLPELPEVPTVHELGYDIVVTKFRGLMGPRGLPSHIAAAWERAVQQVLEDPEYRRSYSQAMLSPAFMGQADFARFVEGFASETEAFLRETGVVQ